jgi:hypothetical protein
MSSNLHPDVEWYLAEDVSCESSSSSGHPPIHMGPFGSEEECRALLASLNQIPRFHQANLHVYKRRKQRERRIQIELPIQVRRTSTGNQFRPATTVDVSSWGALFTGLGEPVNPGEILEILYSGRQAPFRVIWAGQPGTATAGRVGVECLNPDLNIWDLQDSQPFEDETLRQDVAVARAVQNRLLPREKPPLRTLAYTANCVQARTVGGDYYDFLDMGPGQVGFVLADVAGKGIGAALLMASLQGSIHSRADAFTASDLPRLLTAVNHHLYKHTQAERYATLFFGHYDDSTRSLHYVNCGHNPPLLLRCGGDVERLAPTATVLGLFEEWNCSISETRLEMGDLLSVFTDGVIEARCENGEEFGEDRLVGTLHQSRKCQATTILQNVEQAVDRFRSGEREDDLTMVIACAH